MNARSHRPATLVAASVAAIALLVTSRDARAYHMEDPLRGGTTGNQVGGSFDADGWHVTSRTDRIWYALPRLVSGSIEFTMSNVTMASLGTDDNEIFAMYEAGYGITEPISYSQFRVNNWKCMLRIYGNGETGREGQQKLMFGMCPGGAPGYDTCSCATSFWEEPFGGNGTWDGSPQRIRIEWGAGATRYYRNGTLVLTIDWSTSGLTFGPSELHMSLGTSRPDAVDTAQLPVGAVFSDLVVDGTEGDLAMCPGVAPPPDAGTPPPPPPSSGNTIDVPAIEDVTVDPTHPTSVYPVVTDLSDGAADSEFYVKFRVPSVPGRIVHAEILLNSSMDPSAEGSGTSVYRAASDAWSESTLSWNARPGPLGPRLARVDGIQANQPYAFVLADGAVTAPGVYSFAMLPEASDTNTAHFDSKEVSPSRGPVLRLTIDPTMPPVSDDAGTVSPDAGIPTGDAGGVSDAGSGDASTHVSDAGVRRDSGHPSATGDNPIAGGCQCRAVPIGRGSRATGFAFLALAAGLLSRPRRRTRRHG